MVPSPFEATGGSRELATVLGLYALEEVTLGEAADCLDISRMEMKRILRETGINVRVGPETKEDAVAEAQSFDNFINE